MKKLSAKSKLGQYFVEAYNRSVMCALEDAYTKPSAAKQAVFKRCQRQCEAENGRRFRIISFNFKQFTVGFEVTTASGATELRVITRCNDYVVPLGDKI